MQLNPRYGPEPVITFDGSPAAIAEPAIRQRRRLAAALASFDDEQWAHPSRCEGWSNRDVIVHLDTTNSFWSYSIAAGLRGEPTQLLAAFDPVASPAEMVAGAVDVSTAEILDRFVTSTEALVELLASLEEDDFTRLAEAPPGHLTVSVVAHHALWDSWIHERDVLLPLGESPDVESDEVAASLRYAAALSPAFAVGREQGDAGVLAVTATDPELSILVDIGERVVVRSGTADADLTVSGDAVELVEALSSRGSLNQTVPAETAWMLDGLAEAFDQG